MKYKNIYVSIVSLFSATITGLSATESKPPNVVLIFVDDLGYGDLSCYGATHIQTPHIDKLAAQGRKFTDAHSASAVCTPSRYGLLTGEYPMRANIWGPSHPTSKLLIDTEKLTIADVFKNAGYTTSCFGKWHLGFTNGVNNYDQPLRPGPQDLGFDYYFGVPVVNSAPPYVYVENDKIVGATPDDPIKFEGKKSKNVTPLTQLTKEHGNRVPNWFSGADKAHKLYNDFDLGTQLTNRATKWIGEQKDKPFFLYFSTTNIHHPFTPAKQFQGTSEAGWYGDFVHELDWMVGEVVKTLEEQGVDEDTLIIFTSDNGGMMNHGGQAAYKLGHKINGELLGFKFGIWEGGHRVPFIAKWPGKIEAGTTSDQLISGVDMLATFASVTGQDIATLPKIDSIDALPVLTGDPTESVRNELLLHANSKSHLSLRKGKWVYIPEKGSGGFKGGPGQHAGGGPRMVQFVGGVNSDIENGKFKKNTPQAQLYNLEEDLAQTKNVYAEHPEVVKEMQDILHSYKNNTKK